MKKNSIIILLTLAIFSLVACSNSNNSTDTIGISESSDNTANTATSEESESTKEQVTPTETSESENTTSDSSNNESEPENDEESQEQIIKLKKKDVIQTDDFKFTFKDARFTYKVLPSDTSGYYNYYSADKDKIYVDVTGTYKNTSKRDITVDDLFIPYVVYDNDYVYDSGYAAVDTGSDFEVYDYRTIAEPLEKIKYHALIDCPEEISKGDGDVYVYFEIENKKYEYKIKKSK